MPRSLPSLSIGRPAAVCALLAFAAAACAQPPSPRLGNPASQNCVAQGGKVVMETNARGAQYGVCVFEDNRQCEEWAMLRGECRTGGIKVTGYATPAARYCAISGGTYTIAAGSDATAERGNCTFVDRTACTAEAYYEGTCPGRTTPAKTASAGTASVPHGHIEASFICADGKSIDATFINSSASRVRLVFSDGRKMTLPQAMSADGARYADKAATMVFWNKGRTAFVQENGRTTYADCSARP